MQYNSSADRMDESAPLGNPLCNDPGNFFLVKQSADADYGPASTGERRDVMSPDPPCP